MKTSKLCSLLICLLFHWTNLFAQQGQPFVASYDVLHTTSFIWNTGQFDLWKRDTRPVLCGIENNIDRIYFTESGYTWHLQKTTALAVKEADSLEEETIKEETDLFLDWVGASINTPTNNYYRLFDTSRYFSYGEARYKSPQDPYTLGYGFSNLYFKMYPHINVVQDFLTPLGLHYQIFMNTGARPSDILMKYSGKGVTTNLSAMGLPEINTPLGTLTQYGIKAYYTPSRLDIKCQYTLNNGILGIQLEGITDTVSYPAVIIDIYITDSSDFSTPIYNVDYDDEGNVYGFDRTGRIAAYNNLGQYKWTFMGLVDSVGWHSDQVGNFAVDKSTGNIYTGLGAATGGTSAIRLTKDGIWDNFISSKDYSWEKMWNMQFNCKTGSLLGFGGSNNASVNMGVINTSSGLVKTMNFTGLGGNHQEVVSTTTDPKGNRYSLLVSNFNTNVSNKIYRLKPSLDGNDWSTPSGYSTFVERGNREDGLSNSFNALAANTHYLFYYDGQNLKAFSLESGAPIGSAFKNSLVAKAQSGIYADEFNHVYVGSASGSLLVYNFDGSQFHFITNLPIPGVTTHVYDIKYSAKKDLLYVSGESFIAAVKPIFPCDTIPILIETDCRGIARATVLNPDTNFLYKFNWKDSSANSLLKSSSNFQIFFDEISGLSLDKTYSISVTKYMYCMEFVQELNFRLVPSSSTTINASICDGKSFGVGNVFHNTTGTYIDSLKSHVGCDSIVTTNLTVLPSSEDTLQFSFCEGKEITVGTHTYKTTGTYTDLFTNQFGCDSTLISKVQVWPVTNDTLPISFCRGLSYTLGTHTYTQNGDYIYSLTNQFGCDSIVTVRVTTMPAYVQLETEPSGKLYKGENFRLIAHLLNSNDKILSWRPSDGIQSTQGANAYPYPIDSNTWYQITTKSQEGCIATDSIQVIILEHEKLFVPNVFTPNGDGNNELFLIINNSGISQYEYFRIYNRWGQLVFETKDPKLGWDGTINGTPAPTDVYVWMVQYVNDKKERLNEQGNLTLLR